MPKYKKNLKKQKLKETRIQFYEVVATPVLNYNCKNLTVNRFEIKLLSENKLEICPFVNLHYHISREKFEPQPGLKLGPPDLYPGALPLSYPGSTASSPSNVPLEITCHYCKAV